MANVAHADLTGANLHEPKGADTATDGQVYVADGAGSGTWVSTPAHGSTYMNEIGGTPYTLAATTSYQKVAATTVASGSPVSVTEATTSRLTYTGNHDVHMDTIFIACVKQASGAARDLSLALYKNGVIVDDAETIVTINTAEYKTIAVHGDVTASDNDYFELYAKISTATNVDFYVVKMEVCAKGY